MLDEVSKDKSDRPWNSCHAMNKDVGLFAWLVYKVDGSIEVDTKVIVLMVFSRNV